MMTTCPQCGDKGFSNALVYCVKCVEVAVHRYCLDELPDTFDEFVHWVCDDCKVEESQQFISLNSEHSQSEGRDYTNSKHIEPSFKEKSNRGKTGNLVLDSAKHICEGFSLEQSYEVDADIRLPRSAQLVGDCCPLEVKQTACDGATPLAKTKDQIPSRSSLPQVDMNNEVGLQHSQPPDDDAPLKKMKTKKKNEQDVMKFSSTKQFMQRLGYRPHEQPCKAFTENNLNDHDYSTELEKKKASPSEDKNDKNNKESASNLPLLENFMQRIGYSPSEQLYESYTRNNLNGHESTEFEKIKASITVANMEFNGHPTPCEVNTEVEITVTGNQALEFSLLNKTDKKKRVVNHSPTDLPEQGPQTQPKIPRFGPDHLPNNLTLENQEIAEPSPDIIWRGSFNILNKDYDAFEGMVAHMSKKACQRAYEEASLFPTLLDLEMHPKLDVWPESFKKSEPSDDHIALYFFPMHSRYERMFDHLVEEMLEHELAMRAILKNAELLVFTSIELPLNYWRFKEKYYLWGVFRRKQPAQPTSNNHEGTMEGSKHANWKS